MANGGGYPERLRETIGQLREGQEIALDQLRDLAQAYVIEVYGAHMFPGIRKLPLDQTVRVKNNLREMGCDGGFDPIPPQQIEFDASLTPLERFTALLRAALQFYAYSGTAELTFGDPPQTRWGFLQIDQAGNPTTRFLGLNQDMTRYLTDEVCRQLDLSIQTWMQRGDSAHIRQLMTDGHISEQLLLDAYFGEAFVQLVEAINSHGNPNAFVELGDLSDLIDNARLCEFPSERILAYEARLMTHVQALGA